MKPIVYFFLIILFFSCKENTNSENKEVLVNENALESVVEVISGDVNFKDEYEKLPLKRLPVNAFITKDETDIINLNATALSLPVIYENWFNKTYNFRLISGYRLNLSKDFYTAVLKIRIGEIDQEHLLINYNLDGKVIASQRIAIFSDGELEYTTTKSKIIKDEIKLTDKFSVKDSDYNEEIHRTIKILPNGILKELSENELICDFVAKELNIENSKRIKDLEAFKLQPNNPNEAIIVIPEIVEGSEAEEFFTLNSHIAIVDLRTKTITHQYFESYKTNDWISDAIRLEEIEIDTAPYLVQENNRAFGVNVKFVGSSRVNPYYNKTLSLFVKNNQELKNILHNFSIEKSTGEWDGNCKGNFTDIKNTLVVSANKTNNYFDILVKQKTLQTITSLSNDGDCIDDENISESKFVLKFDGNQYKTIHN